MKKNDNEIDKKSLINNYLINNGHTKNYYAYNFNIDILNEFSNDIIDLFKLIQVVRYDRIRLQEKYNNYRSKLNNDKINLDFELMKLKKEYNIKIYALQEEYNLLKSNNKIILDKIRKI